MRRDRTRAGTLLRSAALCAAAVLGFVPGCASTDVAPDDASTARAPDVAASEIARELGLRRLASDDGPVRLEAYGGSQIILFPGTRIASVAGRSLDLAQMIQQAGGETWLAASDADAVRATWYSQAAAGHVSRTGTPSGSYRVPIPDRPSGTVRTPAATPPQPAGIDNRPTSAELAAWSVPLKRRWNYIVVHHSATPTGNASSIDRAHKERGFDGLGYDFVIGNGSGSPDGAVEVGYRWKQQLTGAHAKTAGNLMNEQGIGICLIGNFDVTRPTAAQMRALDRLTAFLAQYCSIPTANLRMHGEVKPTDCPGKHFPRDFAIRSVTGGARTARRGGTTEAGTR